MVEYLKYNGRKIPFAVLNSTLIDFQKQGHGEFVAMLMNADDMQKVSMNLYTIVELGIETGYHTVKWNIFKKFWNLVRYGSPIGVKKKYYKYIVDQNGEDIYRLVSNFIFQKQEEAIETAETIADNDPSPKKK